MNTRRLVSSITRQSSKASREREKKKKGNRPETANLARRESETETGSIRLWSVGRQFKYMRPDYASPFGLQTSGREREELKKAKAKQPVR